jgi:hypothetical protein
VIVGTDRVFMTHAFGRSNYCSGSRAGAVRGTFSLPAGAHLLAADANNMYFEMRSASRRQADLVRAPIDPRCRQ